MAGLNYDIVGPADGRTALIAHGILGMGRNWRSLARVLSQRLPAWRIALVDLRNHGASQGLPGPHTVARCAEDLQALAGALGGVEVAIGHSFGGKVVLQWLRAGGDLRQVWSLDSPPGSRPFDPSEIDTLGVLAAVRAVRTPTPDREAIRSALAPLDPALIAWLLTSTQRDPDGWRWVWDLDAVDAMIRDYLALDLLPWLVANPELPVQLVRAERSDRWTAEEVAALEPHVLSNAGHWLHVDNPAGLMDLFEAHWTL